MRLLNFQVNNVRSACVFSGRRKEGELKFAFPTAAWGENTDDGLRQW